MTSPLILFNCSKIVRAKTNFIYKGKGPDAPTGSAETRKVTNIDSPQRDYMANVRADIARSRSGIDMANRAKKDTDDAVANNKNDNTQDRGLPDQTPEEAEATRYRMDIFARAGKRFQDVMGKNANGPLIGAFGLDWKSGISERGNTTRDKFDYDNFSDEKKFTSLMNSIGVAMDNAITAHNKDTWFDFRKYSWKEIINNNQDLQKYFGQYDS